MRIQIVSGTPTAKKTKKLWVMTRWFSVEYVKNGVSRIACWRLVRGDGVWLYSSRHLLMLGRAAELNTYRL